MTSRARCLRETVILCVIAGCHGSANPVDSVSVPAPAGWAARRGWTQETVLHEGNVVVLLGTRPDGSREVIAANGPATEPLVLVQAPPAEYGEQKSWSVEVGPFLGSPDLVEILVHTTGTILVEHGFASTEHVIVRPSTHGLARLCSFEGTNWTGTRTESTGSNVAVRKVSDEPFAFEVVTTPVGASADPNAAATSVRYVIRGGSCETAP